MNKLAAETERGRQHEYRKSDLSNTIEVYTYLPH